MIKFKIISEMISNRSIWPIDRILKVATTLGQSGPESSGKKEVIHTPRMQPTDTVSCRIEGSINFEISTVNSKSGGNFEINQFNELLE